MRIENAFGASSVKEGAPKYDPLFHVPASASVSVLAAEQRNVLLPAVPASLLLPCAAGENQVIAPDLYRRMFRQCSTICSSLH